MRIFGWSPLYQGLLHTAGRQLPGCALCQGSVLEYFIGERSWEERILSGMILSRLFQSSVEKSHKWWCVHPNTYTCALISTFA